MKRARPVVLFAAAASTMAACVGTPQLEPSRDPQTLVVLLPDADTSATGRAQVWNASGTVQLIAARDATSVRPDSSPSPAAPLSSEDVERIFGPALAALPAAPRHFTLYFQFESDELTVESRALVREILATVKNRVLPEVAVVGHTDTMGTAAANLQLGLKRAATVRKLLIDAGLGASLIDVTSHGESDPLVRTADGTAEPRNRRVDIAVR